MKQNFWFDPIDRESHLSDNGFTTANLFPLCNHYEALWCFYLTFQYLYHSRQRYEFTLFNFDTRGNDTYIWLRRLAPLSSWLIGVPKFRVKISELKSYISKMIDIKFIPLVPIAVQRNTCTIIR